MVIISAMLVQKEDFAALIARAKLLGKRVAVGGPYPTSLPEEAVGTDYFVLDEGEMTIPMFLAALERGESSGTFRSAEKPDVTKTPIPRFDLINFRDYVSMSIQFSRGCPFMCEFCDIITLYGRVPRTKTPTQVIAELDYLFTLGWRGQVFLVDDNFIGNKRNVKVLLEALIPWSEARDYPFAFYTEASVNLAQEPEVLELMVKAGFWSVFLGIETPDEASLVMTKKLQNTRLPLVEACEIINKAGLDITAGFILGFDGEKQGAGDRIYEFVEATAVPRAMVGILHALPNTGLYTRLQKEGRLLGESQGEQGHKMNFVPERPVEDIVCEFTRSMWNLYEPRIYFQRVFRQFQAIDATRRPQRYPTRSLSFAQSMKVLFHLIWVWGICSKETRGIFWTQLRWIQRYKEKLLPEYIAMLAMGEHFFEYRVTAREHLTEEMGFDPLLRPVQPVLR